MSKAPASQEAKRYYTLNLDITHIEVKEGRNGPYAVMAVDHRPTEGPNVDQVLALTAVCAGRGYESLRDDLVENTTIRVYGHYEKAADPSKPQRFIIGGRPREVAPAEATIRINGHPVPMSEYHALLELWRECPDIHAALTEPMGEPVRATAQNPHVVAGRVIPYDQDRKFRTLLGRCRALRQALDS